MKRKYTKRKRNKKTKKVGSFYDLLIPGKRFNKKSRRKARHGGLRGGSRGVKLPPDAMRRAKKAELTAISRQQGKPKAAESSSDEDEDSDSSDSTSSSGSDSSKSSGSDSSKSSGRKKTQSPPKQRSKIIGPGRLSTADERRRTAKIFLNRGIKKH